MTRYEQITNKKDLIEKSLFEIFTKAKFGEQGLTPSQVVDGGIGVSEINHTNVSNNNTFTDNDEYDGVNFPQRTNTKKIKDIKTYSIEGGYDDQANDSRFKYGNQTFRKRAIDGTPISMATAGRPVPIKNDSIVRRTLSRLIPNSFKDVGRWFVSLITTDEDQSNLFSVKSTYEEKQLKLMSEQNEDSFLKTLFKGFNIHRFDYLKSVTDSRRNKTLAELVDSGETVSKDVKGVNYPSPSTKQTRNKYLRDFRNNYDQVVNQILGNNAGIGDTDFDTRQMAARAQLNLGQIQGGVVWHSRQVGNNGRTWQRLSEDKKTTGVEEFNASTTPLNLDDESSIDSSKRIPHDQLNATLEAVRVQLQEEFDPLLIRPSYPKPVKFPLDKLLQQNLLMPSNGSDPTTDDMESFRTLYMRKNNDSTNNRGTSTNQGTYITSGGIKLNPEDLNDPKLLIQGAIAGVPVSRLEEPILKVGSQGRISGMGDSIHNFEQDYKLLAGPKQDDGFTSNITTNESRGANYLDTAVKNFPKDGAANLDIERSIRSQYFPFFFETINKRDVVQTCALQATLSQFSENITPQWNPTSFFGRTDKIWAYIETDRTIDIRFVIFANESRQLQNVIERVNWLTQQAYPDYNSQNRMSSGPLVRMTIGDLIHRVPGFFRNISLSWDHAGAGGKWELSRNIRMPISVEVSTTFQVIHEFNANRNTNFYHGLFNSEGIYDKKMIENTNGGNSAYIQEMKDNAPIQGFNSSAFSSTNEDNKTSFIDSNILNAIDTDIEISQDYLSLPKEQALQQWQKQNQGHSFQDFIIFSQQWGAANNQT